MFLIFVALRLFMMTTNLFVIANVKQLRTDGSFRILLPFFRTSWSVGVPNSAIFNSFHNRVIFGTILEGLQTFGGGLNPPNPPPSHSVRHCGCPLLAPRSLSRKIVRALLPSSASYKSFLIRRSQITLTLYCIQNTESAC